MNIKGTAVYTTHEFINEKYPKIYKKWLKSLPKESHDIFKHTPNPHTWYPIVDSVIVPMQVLSGLLNQNSKDTAFDIGRYSGEKGLKGVYKVFVSISSPSFMLSRAPSIFNTYYDGATISVVSKDKNKATFSFDNFTLEEELMGYRITGWMVKALEVVRRKNIRFDFNTEVDGDSARFYVTLTWE